MDKENVLYLHSQVEKLLKKYQSEFASKELQLKQSLSEISCKQAPYGIDASVITQKCQKFRIMYDPQEPSTYQEVNDLIKTIDDNLAFLLRVKKLQRAYPEWSKPHIEKYETYIQTTIKKSSFLKRGKSKLTRKTDNTELNEEEAETGKKLYMEFLDFLYTVFLPHEIDEILQDILIETAKATEIIPSDNEIKEWTGSIYGDSNRINFTVKYKYEKKCHFRDTLNQFQGLQNKCIPEKVLTDLKEAIEKHGLTNPDETDPIKRFARVTLDHIRIFLTETNHNKYYEDLQLIYSKISGKKCPDISRYEKQLYDDFDELVEAFLSMPDTNRKNFLNVHYVLRQLLKRRGYRVPENSLSNLKTPSRMREHDDIYQKCCEKLQWNFTPLY